MIDFTRAFESAWERMLVILFRPFDPGKWFLIGFNAFLVLLGEGNISFNQPFHTQSQGEMYSSMPAFLHATKQVVPWVESFIFSPWGVLYTALAFVALIVWLLLNWVGCRGQFLFLDNVVRNRAAMAWPWHRYARESNVWFVFNLGFILLSWILLLGLSGIFVALNWTWISQERYPNAGEGLVLAFAALIGFGVWLVYAAITFLLRSFVVPLLFKQTFGLGGALGAVGRLVTTHSASVILYLLISFCLAVAVAILSMLVFCLACCMVCWFTCIPFIGSLLLMLILSELLLPVIIFCRCFQLDCLAQFGPEYDVWIVDVPQTAPVVPPGFTPPPPLG